MMSGTEFLLIALAIFLFLAAIFIIDKFAKNFFVFVIFSSFFAYVLVLVPSIFLPSHRGMNGLSDIFLIGGLNLLFYSIFSLYRLFSKKYENQYSKFLCVVSMVICPILVIFLVNATYSLFSII